MATVEELERRVQTLEALVRQLQGAVKALS